MYQSMLVRSDQDVATGILKHLPNTCIRGASMRSTGGRQREALRDSVFVFWMVDFQPFYGSCQDTTVAGKQERNAARGIGQSGAHTAIDSHQFELSSPSTHAEWATPVACSDEATSDHRHYAPGFRGNGLCNRITSGE
jgi:hypothetical protein